MPISISCPISSVGLVVCCCAVCCTSVVCCCVVCCGLLWYAEVCCAILRCAVACCGVHLSSGVKLFGVTQRELVGEGVRRLLPHPICNYAQVGAHPYSSLAAVDHAIWDTHSVLNESFFCSLCLGLTP